MGNKINQKTRIDFRGFGSVIKNIKHGTRKERGQSLVITAVAFLAILAFAGLVTDAGTLYLSFTRLKRALDAGAVAAANQIRDSSLSDAQRKALIRESAREMLVLNDIDDIYSLEAYVCDDELTIGIPADFATICPDPGELKRKLAWIQATQNSPVYFLHLFGISSIPITTHSIGEAASLDVVIVIDTSESMASETPGFNANDFDPTACNAADNCEPLRDAKTAANGMIAKFFDKNDRIAVVTYDVKATVHDPDLSSFEVLEANHSLVVNTINSIQLFDGPSQSDIAAFGDARYGLVNPMDLDGDGTYYEPKDIIGNTCGGCGMRVAGDILKAQGRVDSVWIIVFLSDGRTNISDLPDAADPNNQVPAGFVDGFCGGAIGARLWTREPSATYDWCNDSDPATRHCGPYHVGGASECPDGAIWVGNTSPPYDTEDYARDMTDRVALVYPIYNPPGTILGDDEPKSGDEIAIYAIGLGDAGEGDQDGELLLRYMANIGDDNFRNPIPDDLTDAFPADPCEGIAAKTSCGQYYYAPDGSHLAQIFEKVAGSIFTRITQ